MKYKLLKAQNNSFRKTIEHQNKTINSQRLLIDKIIKEKLDMLSRMEIILLKLKEKK